MSQRPPSLFGILQVDYWALLGLLGPLVVWVIYLGAVFLDLMPESRGVDPLMGANGRPLLFWLAAGAALVGLPTLLLRIALIRRVLAEGKVLPGVITGVWFYRDRGRVEYTYEVDGATMASGHALHKAVRTRQLQVGQAVDLVVDPQNPQRAFIRSLFLGE